VSIVQRTRQLLGGAGIGAVASLALAAAAGAAQIDYSADRPEALRACDGDRFRGERGESARCYAALLAGNDDVRIKAEAAAALGSFETANDYFRQAFDAHPEDPRVRTRWGKLFARTYKDQEAVDLYYEALALDAEYVPAIVALAEAAAERREGQARDWLEQALSLDPDSIAAQLLLARLELEVGNLDSAEVSLDRALELVERNGHPPVEVYALKAAADLQRNVFDSPWIARALEYNPIYGEAYATPAYFFVISRRYRQAIDFYERAVEIEPDLYTAHTELGVNLLRDNRMEDAYAHLERAFNGGEDFNPRTVNTLRLIDSFEHFTVERFAPDTEPAGAGAGVLLRLHEDETDVLTPYLLELINDSVAAFSERYDFTPDEPVIIELYPEDSDFSVRTAGLPGIGLLGVTFGYLVAMNSPPPGLGGDFHWGTTLWHEMAHIFTLEATDHLVPRWFSEGVSVYEEWSTGPLAGRHIPNHVLQAMAEDEFLPVADLDEGFIRPTYENQVIVSYMQAGLICEYIAENFGQTALQAMLVRFREGEDTAAALEAALAIPPAEFDRRFAAHIETEFGEALASLEEWSAAQQAMVEAANAAEWEGVVEPAESAIALMPQYVDSASPYLYLARAQREAGDTAAARATLASYYEYGGYSPEALQQLARWYREEGDTAAAIEVLEATVLVAPLEESVHAELGDLLLESRPADALREFTVLAALEPHDQASLNLRFAKAHHGLGNIPEATEHLLYALEIAPHFREAQQLLLEIVP
jgi:tetratricopeptide (TPR) repeat protein